MSPVWHEYSGISRTPWYSLMFIMPLVVLYELLALLINWESAVQLRNGADVLLRQLLRFFGVSTPLVMGLLLVLAVAGTWYWQRRSHGVVEIHGIYLVGMLLESLVWAGVLVICLSAVNQLLIVTRSDTVLRTAFLAVGAGIYEEGVFRLVLITGMTAFLQSVLHWHEFASLVVAILVAATLFSLFHYVGPVGEIFAWNSFGYRSVAGVMLGILFIFRGFGITVYAHTGYNLLVLGIQTVG
ncbi:type II CAAX prenyl endopeptidase Rce1 family protein [Candidatus Neomarinimicrobiota bacterium]